MRVRPPSYHIIVAAVFGISLVALPFPGPDVAAAAVAQVGADDARMQALFAELAQREGDSWKTAEADILREWSRSGSAVADLLLQRGEIALDSGDPVGAIGHLTALTETAPDFAEGYSMRAAAYYAAGQFGPAFEDVGVTLRLQPRHWLSLTLLGQMFQDMGQGQAAIRAYARSLAINPHQQDAADALARLERDRDGTAL